MAVSYKRLWKLLIDKEMKKKDLSREAKISTYTIAKLNRGENVFYLLINQRNLKKIA